jgi:hypothetical protein
MKLPILLLFCFLLPVSSTQGQVSSHNAALLVVECEAKNGLCETQHLVRYRFRDGVQVSRDVVLADPDTSFNLGGNHIYQNRYVITRWGDVVDVEKKKLLHDGEGDFVGTDGSRVIQHVDRRDVKGFFYYDLESNRYARLRSPKKWALPGLLSPDQTRSISTPDFGDGEIWLHTLNKKKKLLGSKFRVGVSGSCSMPTPPVLWLDDKRILTQRTIGEIVILHLNGRVEPLLTIPITDTSGSVPSLDRDAQGRITYAWSGGIHTLDVENKKHLPYEWAPLGHGFELEVGLNQVYGEIARFNGQEIGRWWSSAAITTEGFVAMIYGEVGSNLGYPKGVKVWNSKSKEWVTIDAKWMNTIIGWITE